VVLFTPPGHENRIGTFSNVTFTTDDIDRTHQELAARGVVFTAPPTKQPWGQFAKFQDVDGNQFVLSTINQVISACFIFFSKSSGLQGRQP
jgi:predicted enzyme related to lactoylglutathione lyase